MTKGKEYDFFVCWCHITCHWVIHYFTLTLLEYKLFLLRYTGEEYGVDKLAGRVMPQEVYQLSKTNFPLCMKSMQEVINTTHHIKYKARLQYGLFLKGIGLTLEDAIKFFREEFTKRTDVDVVKFEKEYVYGIR